MANILKQLSDEHEEVSKLLETLSQEDSNRIELLDELRRNLLSHAKAEELEFYAHIRSLDEELASKVEDALQEHQEVEKLLGKLQKVVNDDENFSLQLEELKENVEHHVEEEEGEIFALVEDAMSEDELVELRQSYLEAKRTVMETIEPLGDQYAEMTKGELYEEAKAADIPGRSQMTRDELEEEVRGKEK